MESIAVFILLLAGIVAIIGYCYNKNKEFETRTKERESKEQNDKNTRAKEENKRKKDLFIHNIKITNDIKYENPSHSKQFEYLVDMDNERIGVAYNSCEFKFYPFSSITGSEIIILDSTSTNISGAITGGILFGAAGAVIGSQSNKPKNIEEYKLVIYLKNLEEPQYCFELYNNKSWRLESTSDEFKEISKFARDVTVSIKAIVKLNKQELVTETKNIEERLNELENLKNKGLITDNEYAERRQKILSEI